MARSEIGRKENTGCNRDGKEKRGIISTFIKRVMDCPGNENDFMLLCKHCLMAAKDFFPNIDNTIEERIFKGVIKLINLCYPTIRCSMNSEIGLLGKMPVNIIRDAK